MVGAVDVVGMVDVVGVVDVVGAVGVVVLVLVLVVDEVVVVVEPCWQWSSLPRALPWSSQSCPFGLGSGRQPFPEFPWEQSSPGEPGTVVDGAAGAELPGVASALEAPTPAIRSPARAKILAACCLSRATKVPFRRASDRALTSRPAPLTSHMRDGGRTARATKVLTHLYGREPCYEF